MCCYNILISKGLDAMILFLFYKEKCHKSIIEVSFSDDLMENIIANDVLNVSH